MNQDSLTSQNDITNHNLENSQKVLTFPQNPDEKLCSAEDTKCIICKKADIGYNVEKKGNYNKMTSTKECPKICLTCFTYSIKHRKIYKCCSDCQLLYLVKFSKQINTQKWTKKIMIFLGIYIFIMFLLIGYIAMLLQQQQKVKIVQVVGAGIILICMIFQGIYQLLQNKYQIFQYSISEIVKSSSKELKGYQRITKVPQELLQTLEADDQQIQQQYKGNNWPRLSADKFSQQVLEEKNQIINSQFEKLFVEKVEPLLKNNNNSDGSSIQKNTFKSFMDSPMFTNHYKFDSKQKSKFSNFDGETHTEQQLQQQSTQAFLDTKQIYKK